MISKEDKRNNTDIYWTRGPCATKKVSEWLLLSANSAIFQLYHSWREQVNFQWDVDEVCFVLDQHAGLDFYSASSVKQQSMRG